jgi:hypothetical protein
LIVDGTGAAQPEDARQTAINARTVTTTFFIDHTPNSEFILSDWDFEKGVDTLAHMCGEKGQTAQLICNRSRFISTPTQSVGNPFQFRGRQPLYARCRRLSIK